MSGLVSLSFDDALPQHLDVVLPLLQESQLPGTFYAHLTAPALSSRLDEWRTAARQGHELGNHTVFHPAPGEKSWVPVGTALDEYSLPRMQRELEAANLWLTALEGRSDRTYAYPCGFRHVGRPGYAVRLAQRLGLRQTRWPGLLERWHLDWGSTRQDYVPLVQTLFAAARVGGLEIDSPIPPLNEWNRWLLFSTSITSQRFDSLRQFAEQAIRQRSWAIFQFHGVGGGHSMNADAMVFRNLVRWLADHHACAVVTVRDGARRIWDVPESASPASAAAAGAHSS